MISRVVMRRALKKADQVEDLVLLGAFLQCKFTEEAWFVCRMLLLLMIANPFI